MNFPRVFSWFHIKLTFLRSKFNNKEKQFLVLILPALFIHHIMYMFSIGSAFEGKGFPMVILYKGITRFLVPNTQWCNTQLTTNSSHTYIGADDSTINKGNETGKPISALPHFQSNHLLVPGSRDASVEASSSPGSSSKMRDSVSVGSSPFSKSMLGSED